MAYKDKYAEELLSNEQLDQVVGGSNPMLDSWDINFFKTLGMYKEGSGSPSAKELFARYGVTVEGGFGENYYKFQGAYSYSRHPRVAALGYVLDKIKYPGYSGEWWKLDYTEQFIKDHFGKGIV